METIKRENLQWLTIDAGTRFIHFIIDIFVIGLISRIINFVPHVELGGFLDILIFPFYYILFEYYFAWTPGKLVSGTVVIMKDYKKPDLRTIILRTFCRYVPFEQFTFFGSNSFGWHDRWTKTYVVKRDRLKDLEDTDIFNSQLGRNVDHSKTLKSALIGLTILLVMLSAYLGYKTINSGFNFESTNTALRENNLTLLEGEWNTNWAAFKKINFIDSTTIHATNNQDEIVELYCHINPFGIKIYNNFDFVQDYIITNQEKDKVILTDISTMQNSIVLTRD